MNLSSSLFRSHDESHAPHHPRKILCIGRKCGEMREKATQLRIMLPSDNSDRLNLFDLALLMTTKEESCSAGTNAV